MIVGVIPLHHEEPAVQRKVMPAQEGETEAID